MIYFFGLILNFKKKFQDSDNDRFGKIKCNFIDLK